MSNSPEDLREGALLVVGILVVDEQGLMLEGLRTILELEEDFQVVGMAKTAEDAFQQCQALTPQVVVMDIPEHSAVHIEAIATMKRRFPDVTVVGLSSHCNEQCILRAIGAGVDGYLLKDSPSEELIRAVRIGLVGGVSLSAPVARRVVDYLRQLWEHSPRLTRQEAPGDSSLTARETDVLKLVAEGLSNREIGEALYITEGTVKNHVSSVCRKLGARDRTQIAVYAWRHAIMHQGCLI